MILCVLNDLRNAYKQILTPNARTTPSCQLDSNPSQRRSTQASLLSATTACVAVVSHTQSPRKDGDDVPHAAVAIGVEAFRGRARALPARSVLGVAGTVRVGIMPVANIVKLMQLVGWEEECCSDRMPARESFSGPLCEDARD
mgnify:FL=1